MRKENKRNLYIGAVSLTAFIFWTLLVRIIDVRAIGPNETTVGFAEINYYIHNLTGVNMALYNITDWLGLVPITFAMGFGLLGLIQWIKRKNFFKVDYSIIILGLFYIAVIAVYIFFEKVVVNYRPILINGYLEASYPSSTTMLVLCVMPTTVMQLNNCITKKIIRRGVSLLITAFTAFMVIGRIISGVHWITDIIGGALLSTGLVMMYRYFVNQSKY